MGASFRLPSPGPEIASGAGKMTQERDSLGSVQIALSSLTAMESHSGHSRCKVRAMLSRLCFDQWGNEASRYLEIALKEHLLFPGRKAQDLLVEGENQLPQAAL